MNVKVFAGLLPLVGAAACYREVSSPQTPVSYGWSNQASATVQGPPGGEMDPGFAYGSPDQPGYPQGYPDGYAGGSSPGLGTEYGAEAPAAAPTEPQDPQAPPAAVDGPVDPYGTGAVDDTEIDTTLNGYGEWIEDDVYGRVWRPYVTVVGVDFTPYETCGSWVWTDYGWTFACTDWSWGWLPFHYGQWAWFDDFGWGWCPGYEWSPAWVDWRDGGGYVGWRPSKPRIRDHRNGRPDGGPTVRDHRKHHRIAQHDAHWRFATTTDFGRPHIRAHTYKNIADGLKQTSIVSAPTVKGAATVNASKVMQQRIAARQQRQEVRDHRQPQMYRPDSRQPAQSLDQRPDRPRPSYQPPARPTYQPPQQTYQPPGRPAYQPPSRPTYQPPSRPTYQPPQQGYRPPQQPPSRPTYQPPSRPTYQPPSRPTYQPPSRPTYQPPTRDTSSGSRGGSYSSGSRGGGGGGSYSPPSRSSGGSSHSSGGSKSSSSSSSSSSKSSGSSHSSSHSSGGRSHR